MHGGGSQGQFELEGSIGSDVAGLTMDVIAYRQNKIDHNISDHKCNGNAFNI